MRMRTCIIAAICVLSVCSTLTAQWQRQSQRQIAADAVYPFPSCSAPGPFLDVPNTNSFCVFIQQLAADGISSGCGGGNFCPDASVTRGQMAVFIERAMRGSATWSPTQGDYVQIVVVSPVRGGTNLQNGTALTSAINAITDESATKRYLVFIEPGTYDLGASSLTIPDFIDLQGSGQSATLITSAISGSLTATLIMGEGTVVRSLTVKNSGATQARAILANANSFTLENVTAQASNGSTVSTAVYAFGTLTGLIKECSLSTTSSVALAETLLTEAGASLTILRSDLSSEVTGGNFPSVPFAIGDDLTIDSSTITSKGFASVCGSFVGDNSNLTATNSTFTATSGTFVRAINVPGLSASVTLRFCRLSAIGATNNGAALLVGTDPGTATVLSCSLSASTGAAAATVSGISTSIGMNVSNTQITASSVTSTSIGIATASTGFVRIDNCEIDAGTNAVNAGTGTTVRIGGSRLNGTSAPVAGTGTKVCVNSWDGNYAALASNCS